MGLVDKSSRVFGFSRISSSFIDRLIF